MHARRLTAWKTERLGLAETSWSALFPIEFRELAVFIVLVLLLVVRPAGLFGLNEVLPPKV